MSLPYRPSASTFPVSITNGTTHSQHDEKRSNRIAVHPYYIELNEDRPVLTAAHGQNKAPLPYYDCALRGHILVNANINNINVMFMSECE
jgi:hypothetical protein